MVDRIEEAISNQVKILAKHEKFSDAQSKITSSILEILEFHTKSMDKILDNILEVKKDVQELKIITKGISEKLGN